MTTPATSQPGPVPAACPECDDFRGTSRRGFLRGALAVGGAAAVTAVHGRVFTQTSYAAGGVADSVLVVLSMRGAADGLNLVVPHADPAYYQARPSIAVPSDQLLHKDGFFGLHPSLAPLAPMWAAGTMAAVHATGLPVKNRSHFSAMEEVEDADPGSDVRVGWLNRLVGRDGPASPLEAVQFGGGVPATAVSGPQPVLVAPNVEGVRLAGPSGGADAAARRAGLATAWAAGASPEAAAGFRTVLEVVDGFAPVRASSTTPANGAVYPSGDLANALKATARTIRTDVGAEIITVDHGTWDHHTWIGTTADGNLKRRADEFAKSVAAFFTDLGTAASRVTLVTISEFGRRVKENANGGLDHGHGNVMFLMGAGVKGGYYGTWTPLQNTTDADLLVTTDYRSVLNEVTAARFGASTATVFPGLQPSRVGVMVGQ